MSPGGRGVAPAGSGNAPSLTTNAPEVTSAPPFLPTGNLWISLSEIDITDGSVHSLGALLEGSLGLMAAEGGPGRRLIQPVVVIDGQAVPVSDLEWHRQGHWLPHFTCPLPSGILRGWYCAPEGERGAALRLSFESSATLVTSIELGWTGAWGTTTLTHLRAKPVDGTLRGHHDHWTGSRVVTLTAGVPVLAIAWQPGDGVDMAEDGSGPRWRATRSGQIAPGQVLASDVFVGVATEPDGASATALHLRRRGFEPMWDGTIGWLDDHALDGPDLRPGLAERINANLFFNYFFAQGNCLDTGRPVMVTSRSRQYYVSAAFWSRDAFCWSFPALLLTDTERARQVLVAALNTAGPRVADHALYLNGTSLYPGFELDQAAAPVLAVWRYVRATDDWSVLEEPGVRSALELMPKTVEPWRHPQWDLYATFLLPTDDPTRYPYTTTGNALLAAAFDALAGLVEGMAARGTQPAARDGGDVGRYRGRAEAIRAAVGQRLRVRGPHGEMWAWACDADGNTECREEPPLGLRTLPYWGLGALDDPGQRATREWIRRANPHHYEGRFAGAGAPHFPHPTGFDLANRLLDGDTGDGDPLVQLVEAPMDQGLACESWDVATGRVRTGAAMASMAGLLVWSAWEHLYGQRRWDLPPLPPLAPP